MKLRIFSCFYRLSNIFTFEVKCTRFLPILLMNCLYFSSHLKDFLIYSGYVFIFRLECSKYLQLGALPFHDVHSEMKSLNFKIVQCVKIFFLNIVTAFCICLGNICLPQSNVRILLCYLAILSIKKLIVLRQGSDLFLCIYPIFLAQVIEKTNLLISAVIPSS